VKAYKFIELKKSISFKNTQQVCWRYFFGKNRYYAPKSYRSSTV